MTKIRVDKVPQINIARAELAGRRILRMLDMKLGLPAGSDEDVSGGRFNEWGLEVDENGRIMTRDIRSGIVRIRGTKI